MRFLGLSAFGSLMGRTVFKTRARRIVAAVLVAGALTGTALLLMGSSNETVVYQQTPGGGIVHEPGATANPNAVSSGSGDIDIAKAYPRIYSPKLGIDIAIQPGDGSTPP
ncbi:MAG TPA: hypothetical protein VFO60_10185, partial [Candidatus Dormibacteraeota bacterium]|nr:hypothetical protein [Candidatus Dormibacteraeota bacterium]